MNKSPINFSEPYLDEKISIKNLKDVLQSKWLTSGKYVKKLEQHTNNYLRSKYAIALSNCTNALHISLLVNGIKEGDEVIVPSFTWISSVNSILMVGAKPVFIDIDYDTMNLDINLLNKLISKKTKAILVVHQFGNPCDMSSISKIAKQNNLFVIEDAACAFGSKYKNKLIGNSNNLVCFSLHPRKIITSGEGGIITSNSKKFQSHLRMLINHGHFKSNNKDYFPQLGYNYRLSDIQAAVSIGQLLKINYLVSQRNFFADIYLEKIKNKNFSFQKIHEKSISNYQSFVVKCEDLKLKKILIRKLTYNKISQRGDYYASHKQPFLKKFISCKLQNTEKLSKSILFLPMHNNLKINDVLKVVNIINSL